MIFSPCKQLSDVSDVLGILYMTNTIAMLKTDNLLNVIARNHSICRNQRSLEFCSFFQKYKCDMSSKCYQIHA